MINWDRIEELRDEVGDDGLAEVLTLFCGEMEEVLDLLQTAAPDTLPAHLHFLKGSALNIGLDGVCELCQAAESKLFTDPAYRPELPEIHSAYLAAKCDLKGILPGS